MLSIHLQRGSCGVKAFRYDVVGERAEAERIFTDTPDKRGHEAL